MRVSEISVKRIRANQGLGALGYMLMMLNAPSTNEIQSQFLV